MARTITSEEAVAGAICTLFLRDGLTIPGLIRGIASVARSQARETDDQQLDSFARKLSWMAGDYERAAARQKRVRGGVRLESIQTRDIDAAVRSAREETEAANRRIEELERKIKRLQKPAARRKPRARSRG